METPNNTTPPSFAPSAADAPPSFVGPSMSTTQFQYKPATATYSPWIWKPRRASPTWSQRNPGWKMTARVNRPTLRRLGASVSTRLRSNRHPRSPIRLDYRDPTEFPDPFFPDQSQGGTPDEPKDFVEPNAFSDSDEGIEDSWPTLPPRIEGHRATLGRRHLAPLVPPGGATSTLFQRYQGVMNEFEKPFDEYMEQVFMRPPHMEADGFGAPTAYPGRDNSQALQDPYYRKTVLLSVDIANAKIHKVLKACAVTAAASPS